MTSLGSVVCIRVGTVGELSIHHLKGKTIMKMKMKPYNGGSLKGTWLITKKLDGVNVTIDSSTRSAMSRNDKPLYNFEDIFDRFPTLKGTFEVFDINWETSISLVKKRGAYTVNGSHLYSIGHADVIDNRMILSLVDEPSETLIMQCLKDALLRGEEGLVLYQGSTMYKVKPVYTIDVRITGRIEGDGKYTGKLGSFITNYGDVGSGLSDFQRDAYWDSDLMGCIIEVEMMGWTPGMKMRHPRFKRLRLDKNTENLEI